MIAVILGELFEINGNDCRLKRPKFVKILKYS